LLLVACRSYRSYSVNYGRCQQRVLSTSTHSLCSDMGSVVTRPISPVCAMGLMSVSLSLCLSVRNAAFCILHLEFEFYTLVDKSMYCIYLYRTKTTVRTFK
jgi:hypothetical protein